MNKDIKAKWLAALRSGKYKQGKGELIEELIDGPAHCCLGVLCDIVDPTNAYDWAGQQLLPDEVINEADTGSDNPKVGVKSLSEMNDAGMPFNELADLIGKHL